MSLTLIYKRVTFFLFLFILLSSLNIYFHFLLFLSTTSNQRNDLKSFSWIYFNRRKYSSLKIHWRSVRGDDMIRFVLKSLSKRCEDLFSSTIADSCFFSGLNKKRNYIFHWEIFFSHHLDKFCFNSLRDFSIFLWMKLFWILNSRERTVRRGSFHLFLL